MYTENYLFLMAVANCPAREEMAEIKGDLDILVKAEIANKAEKDRFDLKNRGRVDRKRRNDAKNKGRERSKRSHWDHNMYESGRYHSDSLSAKERRYETYFRDLMKDGSADPEFVENKIREEELSRDKAQLQKLIERVQEEHTYINTMIAILKGYCRSQKTANEVTDLLADIGIDYEYDDGTLAELIDSEKKIIFDELMYFIKEEYNVHKESFDSLLKDIIEKMCY